MTKLGETKGGRELGYTSTHRFLWYACEGCGKERWVTINKGKPISNLCKKCARKQRKGDKSPTWKGGRVGARDGYIYIYLFKDDFFYPMAQKPQRESSAGAYVPEHRLVIAQHLGRCLHRWEIVHHKNHLKDDNRIENLQLVSDDRHKQISILEMRIKQLEAENQALREKVKRGDEG